MKIIIVKGDITEALVDSIVCAANSRLSPSSGECGAIFNSAGYESLKNELKGNPYCAPGNAIITPGLIYVNILFTLLVLFIKKIKGMMIYYFQLLILIH